MTATPDRQFTDGDGRLTEQSLIWADQVTNFEVLTGTGTPEGVIEALIGRQYMDLAGIAGAILYVKRDAEVAGDKTMGWILV